jgi:hypothetical protein
MIVLLAKWVLGPVIDSALLISYSDRVDVTVLDLIPVNYVTDPPLLSASTSILIHSL